MKEKVKELHGRRLTVLLAILLFVVLVLFTGVMMAEQVQRNPIVVHAHHVTTKVPIRDMPSVPFGNVSKIMPEHDENPNVHVSHVSDPVAQTIELPEVKTTDLLSFDGIFDSEGGGFVPPDTNASVGATQVVETVNVAYAVYDKTTGNLIMSPKSIRTLYSPLGGDCATANLSDPTAIYDKAAGVWVITMIAYLNNFSSNAACVAVSTSSDATGTYNLYSFSYGSTLPDYPKLSVWPDAYYLTTDSFPGGGGFTGAESCALDRTNMLKGNPATMQCFQRGPNDFALLPADLDGTSAPPSGAPNFEMDEGLSTTELNLYKFHVDWSDPKNSTFTGPTVLTVAAYSDACGGGRTCIPQPPPGELLDGLGGRLMFRLPYRNFGDHEALVAVHSINPATGSSAHSAARWYEIRNPSTSPTVYQQGTHFNKTISIWNGSIAMDKNGDIAIGVSVSAPNLNPTIAYAGRVPSDPLGAMESPKIVITGKGVQTSSQDRWGDYSSMAIDPSDDCTFWYSQEYYAVTGAFHFNTHLNSFKFTTCN
jgi:hypothetical protein